MQTLTLILDILGTVAFAISGAMTALEKKMDIFGVVILGLTTAVGGGVIRDVILGNTPPATFRDPIYALTAMAVSLIVFLPAIRRAADRHRRLYDLAMLLMDSVGLGVFTVAGIRVAYEADPHSGVFLCLFVGVLTGVGGGVLRDVLAGNTPYIFIKHFYATASLLGAFACVVLWPVGAGFAMVVGAALTVLLRLLAARYHWNLPKAE